MNLPTFRADLHGLRVIGFFAIALWHLTNTSTLIGAISIFFALSGYFFAQKIRQHQQEKKTLNLVTETPKLIWRLFSHMHLVMLPVLLWVFWRGSEAARAAWLESGLSMSFGWGNWHQIDTATDYFSRDSLQSPFFHMWAISAQFQLMIGLLVIGFVITLIKIDAHRLVGSITFLSLLLLTSYLIYLDITDYRQTTEYHLSTFNWIWAILFGVLLAYFGRTLPENRIVNLITDFIFTIVLVLVILGLFGITPLGPHLKDVILLLFAIPIITTPGTTLVSRALSSAVFQRLGTLSFGVFLWHWPLMLVFKNELNVETLDILQIALIIFLSIGLSLLSTKVITALTKFVEKFNTSTTFGLKLVSLAFTPIALVLLLQVGSQTSSPQPDIGDLPALKPALTTVLQDLPDYYLDPRCDKNSTKCLFGDTNSETHVILYGSSLSGNWHPALIAIAEQERWKLEVRINQGCPNLVQNTSCDKWLERNAEYIVKASPDLVITNFSMIVGVPPEIAREGINPEIYRLPEFVKAGIEFVALRGPTFYPGRPLECLQRSTNYLTDCTFEKSASYLPEGEVRRNLQRLRNNLNLIDLTPIFCPNDVCGAADINGTVVYRDTRHITRTYSLTLVDAIRTELKQILR